MFCTNSTLTLLVCSWMLLLTCFRIIHCKKKFEEWSKKKISEAIIPTISTSFSAQHKRNTSPYKNGVLFFSTCSEKKMNPQPHIQQHCINFKSGSGKNKIHIHTYKYIYTKLDSLPRLSPCKIRLKSHPVPDFMKKISQISPVFQDFSTDFGRQFWNCFRNSIGFLLNLIVFQHLKWTVTSSTVCELLLNNFQT